MRGKFVKRTISFRKDNTMFLILMIALSGYAILSDSFFYYERLTGDATLYLSIAEKYMRGDFVNAVNGYWGPLLSWLLIPFLSFGSAPVFAINALDLIFGLLTIAGVWMLSYRFEINEKIRGIILLLLVPILLFISLIEPMDSLLLCILVYYLAVVFKDTYPDRLYNGIMSGLLGSFAYFSKPYGFPFFVSHFLLINVCQYFRNSSAVRKRNVLKNLLAGFVLFSLLSGVWVALISIKYNHLTFSNMGRGVFASLGPGTSHETLEKGDPIFFEGFFEPPNKTAFVIYEDPSFARKNTWSPLESWSSFKHFTSNVSENIFECLRIYESYSRLSVAIIIVYILLLFYQPLNELISHGDIIYPLLTLILYTSGYMPFHLEARYLWIVNILLLLMGGKVLTILFKTYFLKNDISKIILTIFFILSFAVTPIKSAIDVGRRDINKEMHDLGTKLNKLYDIKGNIASNRQKTHDSWHKTFRLAYWLQSRYYGQPREDISDNELMNELKRYNIDYYFFWGDSENIPHFLLRYKELTHGEIPGLKIYSLNERIDDGDR